MKGIKFIVPVILLIGVVVSIIIYRTEISQAIVLQFGDPKKLSQKLD